MSDHDDPTPPPHSRRSPSGVLRRPPPGSDRGTPPRPSEALPPTLNVRPGAVGSTERETSGETGEAPRALHHELPPIDRHSAKLSIHGHTILRELGQGGMGIVFEVEQNATGARRAAKTLKPEEADAESYARFALELEALGALQHPGVVKVHEASLQGTRPYVIMELVESPELKVFIGEAFDEARAAAILIDILETLDVIHRQGIVHRDLKPENIFIDAGDRTKISDFGLARLKSVDGLTRTGDVLGTPIYMAPEQTLGRTELFSHSIDIWACGVILYHLIAGHHPYQSQNVVGVMTEISLGSGLPLRERCPAASHSIANIVRKAMEHRPDDRYRSAREMAEALREFLEMRAARRDLALESRWRDRATLATALVAMLLLLTLSLLYWRHHQAQLRVAQDRSLSALAITLTDLKSSTLNVLHDADLGDTRPLRAMFRSSSSRLERLWHQQNRKDLEQRSEYLSLDRQRRAIGDLIKATLSELEDPESPAQLEVWRKLCERTRGGALEQLGARWLADLSSQAAHARLGRSPEDAEELCLAAVRAYSEAPDPLSRDRALELTALLGKPLGAELGLALAELLGMGREERFARWLENDLESRAASFERLASQEHAHPKRLAPELSLLKARCWRLLDAADHALGASAPSPRRDRLIEDALLLVERLSQRELAPGSGPLRQDLFRYVLESRLDSFASRPGGPTLSVELFEQFGDLLERESGIWKTPRPNEAPLRQALDKAAGWLDRLQLLESSLPRSSPQRAKLRKRAAPAYLSGFFALSQWSRHAQYLHALRLGRRLELGFEVGYYVDSRSDSRTRKRLAQPKRYRPFVIGCDSLELLDRLEQLFCIDEARPEPMAEAERRAAGKLIATVIGDLERAVPSQTSGASLTDVWTDQNGRSETQRRYRILIPRLFALQARIAALGGDDREAERVRGAWRRALRVKGALPSSRPWDELDFEKKHGAPLELAKLQDLQPAQRKADLAELYAELERLAENNERGKKRRLATAAFIAPLYWQAELPGGTSEPWFRDAVESSPGLEVLEEALASLLRHTWGALDYLSWAQGLYQLAIIQERIGDVERARVKLEALRRELEGRDHPALKKLKRVIDERLGA